MDAERRSLEDLLVDVRWARRLAGRLLRDDAEAEDVLQETWRAALANPPDADRPARPWFAAVARNFARRLRRSEGRRRRREAALARPEAASVPGPEELAIRLETQRELASLVAELAEPFRQTVLLRFWEGLSAAEISRRSGVPEGTVRWRLKSALDGLRARLDERHSGRRVWAFLLLPLVDRTRLAAAGSGLAAGGILGGALAMKKAVLAFAVLAAAVCGVLATGVLSPDRGSGDPVPLRRAEGAAGAPAVGRPEPEAGTARPTASSGEDAPGRSGNEDLAGFVECRITDAEGRPIAGAVLRYGEVSDAFTARSGADGIVGLRLPADRERSVTLIAHAAGRERRRIEALVRGGHTARIGDVVLRPGGLVTGRIEEPDGRPAAAARVVADKPEDPLNPVLTDPVIGPIGTGHQTASAADGTFRLDGLPEGWWRVWAGREGMRWTGSTLVEVRADSPADAGLLVLEPLAPEELVEGRVLDPEGEPAPGAEVTWDAVGESSRSRGSRPADDGGRFTILTPGVRSIDFRARDREGRFGEARLDGYRPGSGAVVLRLTRAVPILIHARDEAGAPLAAFTFLLLDAETDRVLASGDGADGEAATVPPESDWSLRVRAEGRESVDLGPFAAGSAPPEVSVVLRRLGGIEGRVLAGGAPVAGARVELQGILDPRKNLFVNGYRSLQVRFPSAQATTDADGAFRLPGGPGGMVLLRVEAAGYAPTESEPFDHDPERGQRGMVVELARGGVIEGRVLVLGEGDPSGTIVAFSRGDGRPFTRRAGADGSFRAENVTPGPWLVEIAKEEIDPGRTFSSSGFGTPEPIPCNVVARPGETVRVELTLDLRIAVLSGRLLFDGRPPRAWKAALYERGGGLVALADVDLAEDGTFRLSRSPGTYRLIVSSPGRSHEATLVVAEVELAGPTPFDLSLPTGPLGVPPREGEEILYHRFCAPGGILVLTPLPAGGGEVRVPAGSGQVVRFELSAWSDPLAWPRVRDVDVR